MDSLVPLDILSTALLCLLLQVSSPCGKPMAEDIDVTYVSNQLQSRVQRNKAYWQLLVIREKELSDSLLQLPRT
jgi:hypothetical protein